MSTRPAASRPVVAVTGLAKEARIAAGPGVRAIAGGGNAPALVAALERELARGACAVMSFGIAGGLAPHLAPGQWVVASAIVSDRDRHATDRDWSERLLRALRPESLPAVWGVHRVTCES